MRHFPLLSLALTLAAPAAMSQIRLPSVPLTSVPLLSRPLGAVDQSLDDAESRSLAALSQVRELQIHRLIRANPQSIDVDDHGNPIVRGEVLALSPSEQALLRAAALHFELLREQMIEAMNIRVVVFRIPAGVGTRKALRELRDSDPGGVYDFNHIYSGSGSSHAVDAHLANNATANAVAAPASHAAVGVAARIGLLDTGINTNHPAFHDSQLHVWGCGNAPVADVHGTEVASLMVGEAGRFHGVQPHAELFAADVYCGKPTGGAVDALVGAFNWLVQQQVAVINVSLVGPPNAMLERTVAALSERGFVIVAAVGNDGPAAPPLYPASYPRVVGVTGVDSHNKALIEAARGPQVMFASPGADLAAATGGGYAEVRGTSFASPIVAALLAARLGVPSPELAAAALDDLAQSAIRVGKAGRDLTYGFGLVGTEYRIDPAALNHR
jgi:subtilisin family serine protease